MPTTSRVAGRPALGPPRLKKTAWDNMLAPAQLLKLLPCLGHRLGRCRRVVGGGRGPLLPGLAREAFDLGAPGIAEGTHRERG